LEDCGRVRKKKEVHDIKFVVTSGTYDHTMNNSMLQHPNEHHSNSKKISRPWVCHYCGRKGHIRPFCFKLYGYPNQSQQKLPERELKNVYKERKPKSDNVGLMSLTSLKTSFKENLYFDRGCSRHMTGVKKFLILWNSTITIL